MAPKSYSREIAEAQWALSRCIRLLDDAAADMKSAKNWGLWDLVGGGAVSSIFKRSKINSGNRSLEELSYALSDLKKELGELNVYSPALIPDRLFDRTFDILFDNIFTDFRVQGELKRNLAQLSRLRADLEQIERILQQEANKQS